MLLYELNSTNVCVQKLRKRSTPECLKSYSKTHFIFQDTKYSNKAFVLCCLQPLSCSPFASLVSKAVCWPLIQTAAVVQMWKWWEEGRATGGWRETRGGAARRSGVRSLAGPAWIPAAAATDVSDSSVRTSDCCSSLFTDASLLPERNPELVFFSC